MRFRDILSNACVGVHVYIVSIIISVLAVAVGVLGV
jgi:hypothetical protein